MKSVLNKKIGMKDIIKWILIILLIVVILNYFFIFVNHHDDRIPGKSCTVVVGKFTKRVSGFVTTYNSATEESNRKFISKKFTDAEYKSFKSALKSVKEDPFFTSICYLID